MFRSRPKIILSTANKLPDAYTVKKGVCVGGNWYEMCQTFQALSFFIFHEINESEVCIWHDAAFSTQCQPFEWWWSNYINFIINWRKKNNDHSLTLNNKLSVAHKVFRFSCATFDPIQSNGCTQCTTLSPFIHIYFVINVYVCARSE